jgi:hypothetical protein
VETRTLGTVTCDAEKFSVASSVEAEDDGKEIFQRNWSEIIARPPNNE